MSNIDNKTKEAPERANQIKQYDLRVENILSCYEYGTSISDISLELRQISLDLEKIAMNRFGMVLQKKNH